MSAIFISHSSKDNAPAELVKTRLASSGHRSIFLDFDPADGIRAGHDWETEIYLHLRGCQALMLLCSEDSIASRWCFAEVSMARALGKHIFPVKIAPCEIPAIVSDRQLVDLTGDPELGFQKLFRGLCEAGLDPKDMFDWDNSRPPYPGLFAFEEKDAAIFFGRGSETSHCIEVLNRSRAKESAFAVVLGASGSGKSSLVRAGVVPRLRRDSGNWLILGPIRPLGQPFAQMEGAIRTYIDGYAQKGFADSTLPASLATSAAQLQTATQSELAELVFGLRRAAGSNGATIVVVLDQLEELLVTTSSGIAQDFSVFLNTLLSLDGYPVTVLATLRSDFLGRLQDGNAAWKLPLKYIPIDHMDLAYLPEVVEGPAHIAGLTLEENVAAVVARDAGSSDALPLLAFALRELYERRPRNGIITISQYQTELGGIEGSLERTAEEAIPHPHFPAAQEQRIRKVFVAMCNLDEDGHYTKRAVPLNDLPGDVQPVLENFIQARLLVAEGRNDGNGSKQTWIEVAHEALFRKWRRLARWLAEDSEFLLWRRALAAQMDAWKQSNQDSGALLRGNVLGNAERWIADHRDELTADERQFVEQSTVVRNRERRKRRGLVATLALVLITIGVSAILINSELRQARTLERVTQAGRGAVDAQRLFARDPELGMALAYGSALLTYNADRVPEVSDALTAAARIRLPVHVQKFEFDVHDVTYSRDGGLMAVALKNGTVEIFEALTHRRMHSLEVHGGRKVNRVAFDFEGKRIAIGRDGGIAQVWNLPAGTLEKSLPYAGDIFAVTFSENGKWLALAGRDDKAVIWNVASWQIERQLMGHDNKIYAIAFSADGRWVATGSADRNVRVWDMASRDPPRVLRGHTAEVNAVAFNADSSFLASGSRDKMIIIWDTGKGVALRSLVGHESNVMDLAFNPQVAQLASSAADGEIRVWNLMSGGLLASIRGHQSWINSLDYAPSGVYLISGSGDHTLRVWDVGDLRQLMAEHSGSVTAVAFHPSGTHVATGTYGNKVRIWDAIAGTPVRDLADHAAPVNAVAFSHSGSSIATASDDKTARLWNFDSGKLLVALEGHTGEVTEVAFQPGDRRVVTASRDGRAILWETENGLKVREFLGNHGMVLSIAFSPKGDRIVTGSFDGTAQIWDVASGVLVKDLQGHGRAVTTVSYSLDERHIVTGSADGTLRLWDARALTEIEAIDTYTGYVSRAIFSKDSQQLYCIGADGIVRRWDISSKPSKQGIHVDMGGIGVVILSIAISADGRYLSLGRSDGVAQKVILADWQTQPEGRLLALAKSRLQQIQNYRSFTTKECVTQSRSAACLEPQVFQ